MKRLNAVFRACFNPPAALLAVLVPVSIVGLTAVFMRGWENTVFAFVLYPLSAYALCALVVRAVPIISNLRRAAQRADAKHRQMRRKIMAYLSIGLTFGIFCVKAIGGILYQSTWLGALACYYLLLGIMRFALLLPQRKDRRFDAPFAVRMDGILLLVLTGVLGAIGFHTLYRGVKIVYPGYLIYAAAAFAFYNLTMGIIRIRRIGRTLECAGFAAGLISLVSALVSLFFLQNAMFAAFGTGDAWESWMNLGTAAFVFLSACIVSVWMLRLSFRHEDAEQSSAQSE